MLKILQDSLQEYIDQEHSDDQAALRKGRETRDPIANISWFIGKAREIQKKNIYFCFADYAKALAWVDHLKLWTILKEISIPDQLI